jgi:hypothetical protein
MRARVEVFLGTKHIPTSRAARFAAGDSDIV